MLLQEKNIWITAFSLQEVTSHDSAAAPLAPEFSGHLGRILKTHQPVLCGTQRKMWDISGKILNVEGSTIGDLPLLSVPPETSILASPHPNAGNIPLSWADSTLPLLVHWLRHTKRLHEGVVVLRVEALVLVDFSLDLLWCVLVVVLLISSHRLSGTWGNSQSQRSKKYTNLSTFILESTGEVSLLGKKTAELALFFSF